MSDNAHKLGRTMVWSNTARLYMGSFEAQRPRAAAPNSQGTRVQHLPRGRVVLREFLKSGTTTGNSGGPRIGCCGERIRPPGRMNRRS
jgi:hypothetical protein